MTIKFQTAGKSRRLQPQCDLRVRWIWSPQPFMDLFCNHNLTRITTSANQSPPSNCLSNVSPSKWHNDHHHHHNHNRAQDRGFEKQDLDVEPRCGGWQCPLPAHDASHQGGHMEDDGNDRHPGFGARGHPVCAALLSRREPQLGRSIQVSTIILIDVEVSLIVVI